MGTATIDVGLRVLRFDHPAPPHLWKEIGWLDGGLAMLRRAMTEPAMAYIRWKYLAESNYEFGFIDPESMHWRPFRQSDPAGLRERIAELILWTNNDIDQQLPKLSHRKRSQAWLVRVAAESRWMLGPPASPELIAQVREHLMELLSDPDGRLFASADRFVRARVAAEAEERARRTAAAMEKAQG